ncbi:MAG: N-acetyltransferase [Xanthomonadales bacterium]|nr:N-acetyltransferase [Xanthomonadales bacterium]
MQIRTATRSDRDDVRRVHWNAFPADERDIVSELAVNLLTDETAPPTIALVAETGEGIAGHIAFSPVKIGGNHDLPGYILAPLGVDPDCQGHRIGSGLVEAGIRKISEMGVAVLFVYGDPEYYGSFGFGTDAAARFIPPYPLQYPFGWQALALDDRAQGSQPVEIECVPSLSNPTLW